MAFMAATKGVKKRIVGIGTAAVAPWLAFVLLSGVTPDEKAQSLALVAFSAACLALIAILLRPVDKAAAAKPDAGAPRRNLRKQAAPLAPGAGAR